MRRLFNFRTTTVILLALILSAVAFGFAAANTVDDSGAGDGSGAISGYDVAVSYTLNGSDPSLVDALALTVTPLGATANADTVQITIDGGTNWLSCTGSNASTAWTCTFTSSEAVSGMAALQVVAVE